MSLIYYTTGTFLKPTGVFIKVNIHIFLTAIIIHSNFKKGIRRRSKNVSGIKILSILFCGFRRI